LQKFGYNTEVMGVQEIRYAARVNLKKPAAEQATLHVGVHDIKRQTSLGSLEIE